MGELSHHWPDLSLLWISPSVLMWKSSSSPPLRVRLSVTVCFPTRDTKGKRNVKPSILIVCVRCIHHELIADTCWSLFWCLCFCVTLAPWLFEWQRSATDIYPQLLQCWFLTFGSDTHETPTRVHWIDFWDPSTFSPILWVYEQKSPNSH